MHHCTSWTLVNTIVNHKRQKTLPSELFRRACISFLFCFLPSELYRGIDFLFFCSFYFSDLFRILFSEDFYLPALPPDRYKFMDAVFKNSFTRSFSNQAMLCFSAADFDENSAPENNPYLQCLSDRFFLFPSVTVTSLIRPSATGETEVPHYRTPRSHRLQYPEPPMLHPVHDHWQPVHGLDIFGPRSASHRFAEDLIILIWHHSCRGWMDTILESKIINSSSHRFITETILSLRSFQLSELCPTTTCSFTGRFRSGICRALCRSCTRVRKLLPAIPCRKFIICTFRKIICTFCLEAA